MTATPLATATQCPTHRFFNTGAGWPGLATAGVQVDGRGWLTLQSLPGIDPSYDGCVPDLLAAIGPRGYRYAVRPDAGEIEVTAPESGQRIATLAPFEAPTMLVADGGAVYVAVDGGLTRLRPDGSADAAWWTAVHAWAGRIDAFAMVLVELDGSRLIVLADDGPDLTRVLVIGPDGTGDTERTAAWSTLAETRRDPRTGRIDRRPLDALTGIALDAALGRLIVVAAGEVLCFDLTGRWIGRVVLPPRWDAIGVWLVDGPCGESRYVVTSANGESLTLHPSSAWVPAGRFVCGPVGTGDPAALWRELRTRLALPPGCTVRLWTAGVSSPPGVDSLPGELAAAGVGGWQPVPGDPRGALVRSDPSAHLWLGGLITGDGGASPAISQARVDVATRSWLDLLPPIYAEQGESSVLLDHLLRWLQSVLRDDEEIIDAIAGRLDWRAADDTDPGRSVTALDELADWLGTRLDERWSADKRRRMVAAAHRLHEMRGTATGLAELLSLRLDAPVEVFEPDGTSDFWVLGDATAVPAALGLSTRLVASAAEGAVVGSTAIPGSARLTDGERYGAPLFEAGAHQFCVRAYASDLPDPADQAALRELIDAEKPAHTTYHLCLIDAAARVGFQARVGLDAIVAGPPAELVLDAASALGTGAALATGTAPDLDPARRPRTGHAVLGHGLYLT